MSKPSADWTYFAELDTAKHSGPAGRAAPEVKLVGQVDGARVIRIAFAAGDTMADHQAPAPILVLGQVGSVEFTVQPENGTETTEAAETVVIKPGSAIHVPARRTHKLHATTDATVTLVLLTD